MTGALKKIGTLGGIMLTISGLMTAMMTYLGLPEGQSFIGAWLPVWLRVALIIAPAGFALMYGLSRLVDYLLPNAGPLTKRLSLGLTMALLMESVMASVTTLQLYGVAGDFIGHWLHVMLGALPFALGMSLIMTFVIKPFMDRTLAAA